MIECATGSFRDTCWGVYLPKCGITSTNNDPDPQGTTLFKKKKKKR